MPGKIGKYHDKGYNGNENYFNILNNNDSDDNDMSKKQKEPQNIDKIEKKTLCEFGNQKNPDYGRYERIDCKNKKKRRLGKKSRNQENMNENKRAYMLNSGKYPTDIYPKSYMNIEKMNGGKKTKKSKKVMKNKTMKRKLNKKKSKINKKSKK